jgi:tetratricopeptide (TPR) repeat protein
MPPDHNVLKEIEQLEQRFAENAQGLVFAHLADAYRRAGEFAKAEGLLLHGLKTHPTYTSAYNVLGRVYLDSERFADSHVQFSKVLELDPQNLIALRALGDLAACGGRIDDARSWYERMLQIDPRSDEAQVGLRRLKGGDVEAAAAGAPEATEAVELEEVTGAEAAEEAFGETAEAAEPWAIDAPSAEGSEETSAEPTAEPGEGLLTGEGKAASSEADDRLAAEAQVEGSEAADSDAEGGAFGLEGLDLGIMDDWTPGFIDGDAVPDEPVADEPSDDDVADSLFEGMIGARGSSVEEEAKPEATGDLVADSIFEGLSGIPDSLSGEPGADEQLVSDVVAESIFEGLSGIPD